MIRLADHLGALARAPDVRPLVVALCHCARQHRPSVADPTRRAVLEAAEAWITGGPAPDAEAARHLPGGIFVAACAGVIDADEQERLEMTVFFAHQIPTAIWSHSAHGRLWAAENDPTTPFAQDPEAARAIAATEARLVAVLLDV